MTTALLNTISTSFTGIQGYVLDTLAVVVPIALGIFGILLLWKIVTRFFKNLAGGGNSKNKENNDDDMYSDDDED